MKGKVNRVEYWTPALAENRKIAHLVLTHASIAMLNEYTRWLPIYTTLAPIRIGRKKIRKKMKLQLVVAIYMYYKWMLVYTRTHSVMRLSHCT